MAGWEVSAFIFNPLEISSISTYVLARIAGGRAAISSEASLKYFLLGFLSAHGFSSYMEWRFECSEPPGSGQHFGDRPRLWPVENPNSRVA